MLNETFDGIPNTVKGRRHSVCLIFWHVLIFIITGEVEEELLEEESHNESDGVHFASHLLPISLLQIGGNIWW